MRPQYSRAERDFIKKHGRAVLNQIKMELDQEIPMSWLVSIFNVSEREIISILF